LVALGPDDRLARAFLAQIIDAVADPIFVKDEQHRWILMNDAMCALMGHPREEVLGKSDHDFFPRAEADLFWAKDQLVFDSGLPNESLEPFTDASGKTHVISTKKSLFRGPDGRNVLVGIIRDLTVEKTLERKLSEAREAALVAASAKASFLANTSHELRAPLNGVLGMSELLLRTELTADQRELTDVIRTSGEEALSIINSILELARLEAGRLKPERRDFNLRETVEQVLGLVAPAAVEKELELTAVVSRDVPRLVAGDPERLAEVLLNLLGHSLKHTSRGSIRLRVAVTPSREPGAVIARFVLADSSPGFTAEQLEHLFTAFGGQDTPAVRRLGGAGLGLAIAKQLAEMMGGRVEVESEPGRGSAFALEIPLEASTADASELGDVRPESWLQRAMIVDRRVVEAGALAEQLGEHGVSIVHLQEVEAVLPELRRASAAGGPIDLVFVDAKMLEAAPGLVAAIRAEPDLASTALVALTSHDTPSSSIPTDPRGPSTVLSRPILESKLLLALHVLAARRQAPTSRPPSPAAWSLPRLRASHRTRILVVEGDKNEQLVLAKMLHVLGHGVELAPSGAVAVAFTLHGRVDLLLVDCDLAETDAFEMAHRIRADRHGGRRTPIIALKTSATDAEAARYLEAGMDDCLSKPVHFETLRERLDRWLAAT
jgi:two-component system sensor histidine kinase/response regulator